MIMLWKYSRFTIATTTMSDLFLINTIDDIKNNNYLVIKKTFFINEPTTQVIQRPIFYKF